MSAEGSYASLYSAVIEQAIRDAARQLARASTTAEDIRAGNEAISFLTEPSGAWAESRRTVCEAAGLDEPALYNRVRKEILKTGSLHQLVRDLVARGVPSSAFYAEGAADA